MWLPFETEERKIYRKMGYFSDQDGIHRRYSNEATNWKEHLEKTKAFIGKAIANKNTKKAAILGSGWLLDLPLPEMSRYFEEVWLFDIRHPAQVSHRIGKLKNIKLAETDISGFAVSVYQAMRNADKTNGKITWDQIKPKFDFRLDDFDFVVSCNLLDQLDAVPLEFLLKHNKIEKEDETMLRMIIQQAHLNMLPVSKSCVITDLEEWQMDAQDQLANVKKLVYAELPASESSETWTWKFDSHLTYHPHFQTWFKVIAFEL